MGMKVDDFIATDTQRATTADALAGLKTVAIVTNIDEAFALALEEACHQGGLDFAIAYSHCANETDFYRDSDFVIDKNCAGIGHPDNADGGIIFGSYRAGARFYVGEMLLKLRLPIPKSLEDARSYAPGKWDQVERIVGGAHGPFPQVATIDDLNTRFGPNNNECVWMCDAAGPEAIVSKSRTLFPNLPDQGDTPPVTEYRTTIPGLPGGPLVTTYPVRFNMIAVDGYQRTGRKAQQPRRSITHGTGNATNQSAWAEAQYFVNGAEGRQASIHACIDDHEVVVCMPLDEIAFQAADGAGPGNTCGFACETMEATAIWNTPGRRDALIRISADFMGRCSARLDIHRAERHWDFNQAQPPSQRHHCPDKLMDTGLWETAFVPQWNAARIDELRRMGGQVVTTTTPRPTPTTTTTVPPSPYPPKRVPVPELIESQGVRLLINTPNKFGAKVGQTIRTGPSRNAPAASGAPIKKGNRYTFEYRTETEIEGEIWLVSRRGSWVMADGFQV